MSRLMSLPLLRLYQGYHRILYQNEFYNKLGDRASFFVPADIEQRLKTGSRERYDAQIKRYSHMKITDPRLLPMVDLIKKHRRGYDQEGYIDEKPPFICLNAMR